MNKKNLPNIPIYIGDWERDCNVLSLESEAAWMRIVFKLWTKGKQNSIKMPTKSLQNLWRCSEVKMLEILDDLIFNEIAEITIGERFVDFTCRRFVKENKLSKTRSEASKSSKTESKPNQTPNKQPTKHQQNTENESDNVNVNVNEINEGGVGETIIWPDFEDFWNLYDKKVGRKEKLKSKWNKLSQSTKEKIMSYLPEYKKSQPEKKYRKNPETFLNNKSWNDEIINKPKVNNNGFEATPEYFESVHNSDEAKNFKFQ